MRARSGSAAQRFLRADLQPGLAAVPIDPILNNLLRASAMLGSREDRKVANVTTHYVLPPRSSASEYTCRGSQPRAVPKRLRLTDGQINAFWRSQLSPSVPREPNNPVVRRVAVESPNRRSAFPVPPSDWRFRGLHLSFG